MLVQWARFSVFPAALVVIFEGFTILNTLPKFPSIVAKARVTKKSVWIDQLDQSNFKSFAGFALADIKYTRKSHPELKYKLSFYRAVYRQAVPITSQLRRTRWLYLDTSLKLTKIQLFKANVSGHVYL